MYGVYKGFLELVRLGIADKMPKIYPCQPKGANSLEQSYEGKLDKVVTLDDPFSIAISIMEPTTGNHAYNAMRESHGLPLTASEEEIQQAILALGRKGFCVEAASAITLACIKRLEESGQVKKDEKTVCVLTSAGIKWPDALNNYVKKMEQ
jgi:threonine synthase